MNPLAWQHRDLVEGLNSLKPKKRGNPVSWIVLAGCAFVIGGLGIDASVREAIFAPAGTHRAPSFSVATPSLPSLPAGVVAPGNARVAMPVINVPPPQAIPALAPDTAAATDPQDDGPLPHAKAKNGPKTTRAHSGKHAKKL